MIDVIQRADENEADVSKLKHSSCVGAFATCQLSCEREKEKKKITKEMF